MKVIVILFLLLIIALCVVYPVAMVFSYLQAGTS